LPVSGLLFRVEEGGPRNRLEDMGGDQRTPEEAELEAEDADDDDDDDVDVEAHSLPLPPPRPMNGL
jgi:hypothetical protein